MTTTDPAPAAVATQVYRATESEGGGHAWVLSDLKSLLETGERMAPFA